MLLSKVDSGLCTRTWIQEYSRSQVRVNRTIVPLVKFSSYRQCSCPLLLSNLIVVL